MPLFLLIHYVIIQFFAILQSSFELDQPMPSVLKAQEANASGAAANAKRKRKSDAMDVDDEPGPTPAKKLKNKQRVLLLSSRGVTHRMRHLLNDLEALLPQTKKG